MQQLIKCSLVYIEPQHNAEDIEHTKETKAKRGEVYASKYYNNLTRGINLSMVLEIRDYHTLPYNNGELRYVIIDTKKYKIEKINKIKGRKVLLDIGE